MFSLCKPFQRVSHPMSGQGGTPSQVWIGGYPIPGLDGEYKHFPRMDGVPPSEGCGTPLSRTGWAAPLSRTGWGTPTQSKTEWVPPPNPRLDEYPPPPSGGEHLLHGRRCASCVHAGGLFCLI